MDKETRAHNRVLAEYQRRMQDILDRYSRDMSRLAGAVQADPDRPFAFSDYPPLKDRHAAMLAEMRSLMVSQVEDAVRQEWGRADRKNDALAVSVIGSEEGAAALGYIRRNTDELEAFMKRKTAGMDLSGRVWDITGQFDTQVQDAIDTALLDGKSADELSREVRNLLHNPDALFRRVRDNRGLLHLSRNAKAYHPGQGVYRSAYMNARRMAATEINMAYRTADHLRVQQMDFVVGIEVHLSGNHNCKGVPPGQFVDICDELQGRYPKSFKFTGWHPFCRCYDTTVLKSRDEMRSKAKTSVNEVKDVPQGFKDWVDRNQDRIANAKQLPYFLRDNGSMDNGVWKINESIAAQSNGTTRNESIEQLVKRLGDDCPKTLKNLGTVIDEYAHNNKEFVAKKTEINVIMKKIFDNNDFGMDIDHDLLQSVFDKGFLNTFETGTTKGFSFSTSTSGPIEAKNGRLKTSHRLFTTGYTKEERVECNIPYRGKQFKRSEYEKYGHLLDRDKYDAYKHNLTQYGDVQIRFKKDKVLTTWTFDDSLWPAFEYYQPSLTSDPQVCSFDGKRNSDRKMKQIMPKPTDDISKLWEWQKQKGTSYIELQYHGKLTIDDVESIVFGKYPETIISKDLIKKLLDKGIELYYIDDSTKRAILYHP